MCLMIRLVIKKCEHASAWNHYPSVMNLKTGRECYYICNLLFRRPSRQRSLDGNWVPSLREHTDVCVIVSLALRNNHSLNALLWRNCRISARKRCHVVYMPNIWPCVERLYQNWWRCFSLSPISSTVKKSWRNLSHGNSSVVVNFTFSESERTVIPMEPAGSDYLWHKYMCHLAILWPFI